MKVLYYYFIKCLFLIKLDKLFSISKKLNEYFRHFLSSNTHKITEHKREKNKHTFIRQAQGENIVPLLIK